MHIDPHKKRHKPQLPTPHRIKNTELDLDMKGLQHTKMLVLKHVHLRTRGIFVAYRL